MEALAQVLSCPICLELFTPPVLFLTCAHNFCKKCLEKILARQNCSHVNGQFSCPMCRKIIYLRGRGIGGLPRNILVESILEKFKYELENLHAKEQDQLSQICEEHGESMNLMCLTDDKPICAICKLFGDHEDHNVAKISEVYAERKERLTKDLDWVSEHSERAEQARKEIDKVINELTYTAADSKDVIESVGASLLKGIQWRMAELKAKLSKEYSTKVEKLQIMANELQTPKHVYHQMKTLLEQHSNSVHFLQEYKILRSKIEKLVEENYLLQDMKDYYICTGKYIRDLMKGIHITSYIVSDTDELIASANEILEAFGAECPGRSLSSGISNESLCQKLLDFFQKANETSQDFAENNFDDNNTPRTMDISLEGESKPRQNMV